MDKERKDLEKEELRKKREYEKETKERQRMEEIAEKENKKNLLKYVKEKKKNESVDRNKIRAVYRKDFTSDLKRIRGEAIAFALQVHRNHEDAADNDDADEEDVVDDADADDDDDAAVDCLDIETCI